MASVSTIDDQPVKIEDQMISQSLTTIATNSIVHLDNIVQVEAYGPYSECYTDRWVDAVLRTVFSRI